MKHLTTQPTYDVKTRFRSVFVTSYDSTYEDFEDSLKVLKPTYVTYQLEECPTTKKRHIQGVFGGGRWSFTQLKKALPPKTFIAKCASPVMAVGYCSKEETRVADPVTRGIPPALRNVKGDVAGRNKMLLEEGAENAVHEGYIHLKDYAKIRNAIKLYKAVTDKPESLNQLDNLWIHGPPGTGKSRYVRDNYPQVYDKPLNKWWDAYENEDTVVLDDFGKNHECLGDHLKRWADHYPFTAEVKGGACTLRPKSVIVTSNYHPNEIWEDQAMKEAVCRRFTIVTMNELN